MGLVERVPDPEDRRSMLVELTDEGLRLIDEAVTAHVAVEHELLESLTDSQQAQLSDLLRHLTIQLEGGGRQRHTLAETPNMETEVTPSMAS
jgi:DNA-binding MarR family transcriptional regulator